MNIWSRSPQIWTAYGLEWRFEYNSFSAKRTVSANGFVLDIPVKATTKFASPRVWLDDWAKKNRKRLPPEPEGAVNLELDLFPPQSVRVELVDDLTPEEERQRLFWERKVERAFYEAGTALKELRDRRLYRSTHKTFEEYVQDRFGMKQSRSYQLIEATGVVDNLLAKVPPLVELLGDSSDKVPPLVEVLPTNERQVRPLIQLEPDQQREVWQQAVEAAGGKVPSGRIVKDIVQRILERTKIPIPYRVGDVCEILIKDNPELRGLGGCWCIVIEVREFSCLVRTWNGEYTVREENLRDLQYSPDHRQNMQRLSDRLVELRSLGKEETVRAILETLGSLKRPYLNPWEEKLLEFLEGCNAR
ncbi:Benzoyl-CoA reductase/2-hydroxyglutaryl-CoA dehydratase subunit, BcrC/BadD/HgdB [Microcystis aeruginosa NIES-2549]|uniref:Benzoyl-CoA reductase/2-hydroxyglutaryl-CoA dehydratase subunit, BcrC/BadD/HgdB n=1 Tax=Microcystis aeruginosa NIES-2549 TaxID=1641812 RepID=A0A0F6U712_MICAE|nr:hypothetical protein [Microcystis aeruginosa]AKE65959.1 Benzoyl-CoA reductase/2-hydroxyglutaryl-CoA dehydratase subunit, BcrC/BadD/HgdB [Microcystis aeruginosa NIES-2549]AOC54367.1 Benzoyl-CoA reductase/2-hydroxyglutaryl-CoA dehydratase subunit, BcrC/BadD/HgdB [Microcystis aeruginosa NIES-2481]